MKREDISKLFKDATEEQISALLDINSRDIGNAKGGATKLQADLDAANAALTTANETIKSLEASKGDATKLQAEIDEFKRKDAERVEAEKQAAAQAELEERFNAVSSDKKFLHDLVRKGVLEDFGKALQDKANRGKSDGDIFAALTKDKDYFASQNPPRVMGPVGGFSGTTLNEASMRAAMGLPAKTDK